MTEIREENNHFVVQLRKCLLVLTRAKLRAALQRGKWWKRHAAMSARLKDAHSRHTEGERIA